MPTARTLEEATRSQRDFDAAVEAFRKALDLPHLPSSRIRSRPELAAAALAPWSAVDTARMWHDVPFCTAASAVTTGRQRERLRSQHFRLGALDGQFEQPLRADRRAPS